MTVTFLFTDIELSSELVRKVGDGAFAGIRADHHRLMREVFEAHGGREVDTAGDGFFVAFASARRAVEAALAAQRALASYAWPKGAEVRVRMGLHTTEAHEAADGFVGLGVHRAARICAAAHGCQILLSGATAGIAEDADLPGMEFLDLGEHKLKGLPRPQRLFQLAAPGLPTTFEPPRTADAAKKPGVGTFCVTDLSGWEEIIRELGDEASAAMATDYHAVVAAVVEAHHGITLERVGDNVIAVFPDASDAIRAVSAVRSALGGAAAAPMWPPVRIAVHSGRWSGDPSRPVASTALLRLMRLLRVVEPGQVLVSQTSAALVEGDRSLPALNDLGERRVPRIDVPARLYELEG